MESDQTIIAFGYPVVVYKSTFPLLFEPVKPEAQGPSVKPEPHVKQEGYYDRDSYQDSSTNQWSNQLLPVVQSWLEHISAEVSRSTKCQIHWSSYQCKLTDLEDGRVECLYGVSLHGSLSQLYIARSSLLKNNPTQYMKTLSTYPDTLITPQGKMKPYVLATLKQLTKDTRTIMMINGKPMFSDFSEDLENDEISIEIFGSYEAVHKVVQKVHVCLDEWMGRFVVTVDMDHRLHMIMGGRHRQDVIRLMREYNTHIYFPNPFIRIKQGTDHVKQQDQKTIFVTGEDARQVEATAEQLRHLALLKQQQLITKNLTCLPKKVDWMLTSKKEDLYKIMYENGTFIQTPLIGNNSNLVVVYGDSSVYVERTIRHFMLIMCESYVSCVQLVPSYRLQIAKSATSGPSISVDSLNALEQELSMNCRTSIQHGHISNMCLASRTEVVFQKQFIEIYGLEPGVKRTYRYITENIQCLRDHIKDTKFQIELSLEHREFISGKKNGKVNKIIKATHCKIIFQEHFNDYNMLIDLYQPIPSKAMEALEFLEDELPAEISFFVPEMYHKRIIGVGGKNIQRIMKKHGVYVKFSNAEEYAALGGYYSMFDNVIARTPSKNAENLYELKRDVQELVEQDEMAFEMSTLTMHIPLDHFAAINNAELVHIEQLSRSKILYHDIGVGQILIEGSEMGIQKAKAMIEALIPHQVQFTATTHGGDAVNVDVLQHHLDLLSQQSHLSLSFYHPPYTNEYCFTVRYRGEPMNMDELKKDILNWMKKNEKPCPSPSPSHVGHAANFVPSDTESNSGRVPGTTSHPPSAQMESFYSFNSRLYAPMSANPQQEQHQGFNYSLFEQPVAKGMSSGKLTYSVPDLRQMFDGQPRQDPFAPNASSSKQPYNDKDSINMLADQLAATSIDVSPSLAASVDHLTLPAEEGPQFKAVRSTSSTNLNPVSFGGNVWAKPGGTGRPSTSSSFNRPTTAHYEDDVRMKVPNSKFCGLSLSHSVPSALNDQAGDDAVHNQDSMVPSLKFVMDNGVYEFTPQTPPHGSHGYGKNANPHPNSAVGVIGSSQASGGNVKVKQEGSTGTGGGNSNNTTPNWNLDLSPNWFGTQPNMGGPMHVGNQMHGPLSSPSNHSDSLSVASKPMQVTSPAMHSQYYPDPQMNHGGQMFPSMFPPLGPPSGSSSVTNSAGSNPPGILYYASPGDHQPHEHHQMLPQFHQPPVFTQQPQQPPQKNKQMNYRYAVKK